MRRSSWLVLVLVVVAACSPETGPPQDSGIAGRVLMGPTCPVVREGSPCPDEPLAADLRVTHAGSDEVVATVRSGEDGHFRVPLEPGSYVLSPVLPEGRGPPFAGPVEVTVRPHAFTRVTVQFDTGIR